MFLLPIVGSYALDRIKKLTPTQRKFKLPKKFDINTYFDDYYGIIRSDEDFDKLEMVEIKVDAQQAFYIRSLPLHHSQIEDEEESNDEYSIFRYHLCPAYDFMQKLLSMGATVEVIKPVSLRKYMADIIKGMVKRYK